MKGKEEGGDCSLLCGNGGRFSVVWQREAPRKRATLKGQKLRL